MTSEVIEEFNRVKLRVYIKWRKKLSFKGVSRIAQKNLKQVIFKRHLSTINSIGFFNIRIEQSSVVNSVSDKAFLSTFDDRCYVPENGFGILSFGQYSVSGIVVVR